MITIALPAWAFWTLITIWSVNAVLAAIAIYLGRQTAKMDKELIDAVRAAAT